MDLPVRRITLSSDHHLGRRLPAERLGTALRFLPDGARNSIAMAFRGRSHYRGPHPAWLRAAADLRFGDHTGHDDSTLVFEAPTLGTAAAELYRPQESWPGRPEPDRTGLDLLGDVIRDLAVRNRDSTSFDQPLLKK